MVGRRFESGLRLHLARIRAVLSKRSLARLLGVAVVAATVALVSGPVASAQVSIDPTRTPTVNTGGWVYQMAIFLFALGALALLLILFGYLRFSPRFSRGEEEGVPKVVRAERIVSGREPPGRPVNITAAPVVVPAPVAVAVGAPAPAAGTAAPPPAPLPAPVAPSQGPPAGPPAAETVVAVPATAEAPVAAVPAPAPAPTGGGHKGAPELDQETFDRVLQEQLDKGVDRRVAEGRARSAAVVAARKKAGG